MPSAWSACWARWPAPRPGTSPAPRRCWRGTGKDETHLLVVGTADRGLCGGFNSSIVREARRRIASWKEQGKTVKILCVGRKGRDQLRRDYTQRLIVDTIEDVAKPR